MRPDHERLSSPPPDDLDEAIDDALGGVPRASQLRDYVAALQIRQHRITRDLELTHESEQRDALQEKLDEINEQLHVLREEESISRFVEDAVKFSYEVHRLSEG